MSLNAAEDGDGGVASRSLHCAGARSPCVVDICGHFVHLAYPPIRDTCVSKVHFGWGDLAYGGVRDGEWIEVVVKEQP